MTRHRGDEWIPMAWAFPEWFIRPRAAVIEAALAAWEDVAVLPDAEREDAA